MISAARAYDSNRASESAEARETSTEGGFLGEAVGLIKNFINDQPALAFGAALTAGVILGWLIKRR